jgi:adenylate cyclase
MKRRLAAILAADVVGYSRHIASDEAGTILRLQELHRKLVSPAIAVRQGRVVKLMGDGILAEFPSVVEAVRCGIEIQRAIKERESERAEVSRITVRIGINLGDIVGEGSDVFGDGVIVASRLEALAKPGGICVSGTVFEHVRGKIDGEFEDLGERQVKNFDRPLRVYALAPPGLTTPESGQGTATNRALENPTVAVLPFGNLSGDAEQEYFSDGITEDLITEISRFRELSVISRSSSFAFKGKQVAVKDVGAQLGARYLVEGSVRRSGDRLRITAQLIDTHTDEHVWAERYDRETSDIFEVQDDVVRRVAGTLVDRLEYDGQRKLRRRSEEELRAYELYLRAREHFFNWSRDENRKADECLAAALGVEPNYAAAHALKAEVLMRDWLNGWSEYPDADLAGCLEAARRADDLDPRDTRVQTALGMARLFHGQLDRAQYHFETALRINPNDTRVLVYYSRHAIFMGESERAIALCEEALKLNPFGKYHWNIGMAYFVARRYGNAITEIERIRNPPEPVLGLLAAAHAVSGNTDAAARTFKLFTDKISGSPVMTKLRSPEDWRNYLAARWPFRHVEDFEHLMQAMSAAGLPSSGPQER